MIAALALAPWIGANPPATYLGTAVVNPVTGAFIYILELRVGYAVLGLDPPALEGLVTLAPEPWIEVFRTSLTPFLVGALTCAVISTLVAYPSVWWLTHAVLKGVAHARARRRSRRERAQRGLLTADEPGHPRETTGGFGLDASPTLPAREVDGSLDALGDTEPDEAGLDGADPDEDDLDGAELDRDRDVGAAVAPGRDPRLTDDASG
jgi:hypothetical protein